MSEDTPMARKKGSGFRQLRLWLAAVLLAAYALYFILFYQQCSHIREIRDEFEIERYVCEPLTISNAVFVVLILIPLLLLWPDLSEVSVLGISLRTRLEAAEAQVQETKRDLALLNQSFLNQQMHVQTDTLSNASVVNINSNYPQWNQEAADQLDMTYRTIRDDETSSKETRADIDAASFDSLKMRLLSEYEELREILELEWNSRPSTKSFEDHSLTKARHQFLEFYRVPFNSVRALRNGIAHVNEVSREEVEEGLAVIEDLKFKATTWIESFNKD